VEFEGAELSRTARQDDIGVGLRTRSIYAFFGQNSPETVSQPSSALSSVSCRARHWSMLARYEVSPATIAAQYANTKAGAIDLIGRMILIVL
jgi:hypothetical protein